MGGALYADDVHLKNGQVFENVIVDDRGDRVVIELEFGQMTLRKSQVLRVEQRATPLQAFHSRLEALRSSADTRGEDWLELAGWAKTMGLHEAHRDAVLMASNVAPDLPALEPMMTRLGYLKTEDKGWQRERDVMHARGLVRYSGDWVTPGEADRRHEQELSRLRRERAVQEERAAMKRAQAAEHVAAAELAREQREERVKEQEERDRRWADNSSELAEVALAQVDLMRDMMGQMVGRTAHFAPGLYGIPQLPLSGGFARPAPGATTTGTTEGGTWSQLARRQPGSIVPISSFRK